MSQPVESAPKDGRTIILEDSASGTYNVAHWSLKRYEWVGENGEPSKITPTHWHSIPRDRYLLEEDSPSPRRIWPVSMAAIFVVVALTAVFFRVEFAGVFTRHAGPPNGSGTSRGQVVEQEAELPSRESEKPDPLIRQQQAKADPVQPDPTGSEAVVQIKETVEVPVPNVPQSKEERTDVLQREFTDARPAVRWLNISLRAEAVTDSQRLEREREKMAVLAKDAATARLELSASTGQYRQALDEERARNVVLAGELANAQREIETQAPLLRKAIDEISQFKQAEIARSARSIEEEREKVVALAVKAAAAQQDW